MIFLCVWTCDREIQQRRSKEEFIILLIWQTVFLNKENEVQYQQ